MEGARLNDSTAVLAVALAREAERLIRDVLDSPSFRQGFASPDFESMPPHERAAAKYLLYLGSGVAHRMGADGDALRIFLAEVLASTLSDIGDRIGNHARADVVSQAVELLAAAANAGQGEDAHARLMDRLKIANGLVSSLRNTFRQKP